MIYRFHLQADIPAAAKIQLLQRLLTPLSEKNASPLTSSKPMRCIPTCAATTKVFSDPSTVFFHVLPWIPW